MVSLFTHCPRSSLSNKIIFINAKSLQNGLPDVSDDFVYCRMCSRVCCGVCSGVCEFVLELTLEIALDLFSGICYRFSMS